MELFDLSSNKLDGCVMLRQNENKELVIYVKVPEQGLHALKIYGKPWSSETESLPEIATYLVAASAGVDDDQFFPIDKSGQKEANKRF